MEKRNSLIAGGPLAAAVLTAAMLSSPVTRTFAQSIKAPGGTPALSDSIGPNTFRHIAEAQMPMVVNIRTESRRQTRDLSEFFGDDLFDRFFDVPPVPRQPRDQITQGAGSGFIIDKNGLILTNNHVVTGATRITVALYADEDEVEYDARVVGRDPLTDSALIELTERPSRDLPVATLGSSDDVKPGDWVMAIGNPFNLAHTVTVGVISAIGRPFPVSEGRWQDVLQTDAAINPGNSGGPLLNLRGEVVGINTAIMTGNRAAGNVGVGFAIPIDTVRELLPELRKGTVTRGRIGVRITPVTRTLAEPLGLKEAEGALVRSVEREGPAAAAGIEPGDVIVRYDGRPVVESRDLVEMVTRTRPETTVPIELVREGQRRTLQVTVAALEPDESDTQPKEAVETGFGMSLRDLTPELRTQLKLPSGRSGAIVTSVDRVGPAARAGIRAGDVVLEVNRTAVSGATEAVPAFALLWRQGQELFVTMTRE